MVVPDAGHLAPMERPDLVNRALLELVAKVRDGAGMVCRVP